MRENSSRNQDGLKYQKLYNWGRTLIMSGVLRNMDKFPSEHMLQNKFGYSRQTVRNALNPGAGRADCPGQGKRHLRFLRAGEG